ncbi:MAG TPA: ABC transporter ATP-binding protein [Anaerolineales bacterium]
MIELKQLSVGYPGLTVLRELDLRVEAGEVLAVVGPNGVGKSTLVRAASGALRPLAGSVEIDGLRLHELTPAQRARMVSVVPQASNLPPAFTALDVVILGRTPYLGWLGTEGELDHRLVAEAMARTETLGLAQRRVGELSGGEQQRLLIARALAQGAPAMLLDEPTAHLDLRHQDRVLKLVRRLTNDQGLSVLLALHDLNLVARFADRVALLSDGRVRKIGRPQEVLTPEELAAVYGIQIHVMTNPFDGKPLVLAGD